MNHDRHQQRFGLTLIELLLVLAILVIVLALAAPAFTNAFESQRLRKSADLVRTEMMRARIRSIKTGEDYVFFYLPGTNQFGSAPFSSSFSGTSVMSVSPQTSNSSLFEFGSGLLPDGILFEAGEIQVDERAAIQGAEGGAIGLANGAQQILFYPDGSCQDAQVVISLKEEIYVQVSLRGLTGTAKVSGVLAGDEL